MLYMFYRKKSEHLRYVKIGHQAFFTFPFLPLSFNIFRHFELRER